MILANTTNVAVALIEPRIPQNAGNIGRLCQCAGVPLYLVGDLGFRLGDKYLERAGMDYLKGLEMTHLSDDGSLRQQCEGYTSFYLSTKAKKTYTDVVYPEKTLLVFGREDKGLPEWVIRDNPQTSLRIPMVENARSLNLSNSVAIVLYEVLRQHWQERSD